MNKTNTQVKNRWVIILQKAEALKWQDVDFKMVARVECDYSEDYYLMLIEAFTNDCDYTAQEVMEITGALAIHEEYSKAVIMDPLGAQELGDFVYNWEGGGNYLLGDMLTDIERLQLLMYSLYEEYEGVINLSDVYISIGKDLPYMPLGNNILNLFTEDIYGLQYGDNEPLVVWWGGLIEHKGHFVVILDEDNEDEEEDKTPVNSGYKRYYSDWWDEYYDY